MALPYVTEAKAAQIAETKAKEEIAKVPAPAGGTKLYRHTLKQGDNKALIIITTLSTPIVLTYEDYSYCLNGVGPAKFIRDNAIACYVTDNDYNYVGIVQTFSGGGGSSYNAYYYDTHTSISVTLCPSDKTAEFLDTITEL